MAKKRALITGVTGMVGSHLTDFLLENTGVGNPRHGALA